MFRLPALCCKFLYNLFLSPPNPVPQPPRSSSLRISWDTVSQAWSPKNSHKIKYNSQLLGLEYFLKSPLHTTRGHESQATLDCHTAAVTPTDIQLAVSWKLAKVLCSTRASGQRKISPHSCFHSQAQTDKKLLISVILSSAFFFFLLSDSVILTQAWEQKNSCHSRQGRVYHCAKTSREHLRSQMRRCGKGL